MAQLSLPPIPYKMYRHFAVMTIGLTVCLGIFADGENREAISSHIEEKEREAELRRQSQAMFGQSELIVAEPEPGRGSFGSEGGDYGSPALTPGGASARRGNFRGKRRSDIPGYSRQYVDALSEEEYEALLASVDQGLGATQAERERNLRNLERLSRARSG